MTILSREKRLFHKICLEQRSHIRTRQLEEDHDRHNQQRKEHQDALIEIGPTNR